MMKVVNSLLLMITAIMASVSAYAENAYQGPISDAHSHIKAGMELDEIIRIMDENNVDSIVIMPRDGKRFKTGSAPLTTYKELKAFRKQHPERVYLGIGMQVKPWRKQDPMLIPDVRSLAKSGEFSLIGEVVLKDDRRKKKKDFSPSGKMFKDTLNIATKYQMPVVIHSFYTIGKDENKLLKQLRKNKDLTVVWAHMCGFSNPRRISQLFEEFPNLHCDLAYLPKTQYIGGKGIVDEGFHFTPAWKKLIESYPDRFLAGVDVTTKEQYRNEYSEYIRRIRIALGDLSPEVARKVATENFHRIFSH